jgi:hypothetical protein
MIFINNKYTNWYDALIIKAKNRTIHGYTENHHIIPRSLGGTDDKNNLVKLTAKEHFICHLLLTKMVSGNAQYKMNFALHMLSNIKNIGAGRYIPSSRMYDLSRKLYKQALDNYWTDDKRKEHAEKVRPTSLGRKHKEATKEKHRNKVWTEKAIQTRLNNCLKSAAARKGKTWSKEHRTSRLTTYLQKNLQIAMEIIALHDSGLNNLQISKQLQITWDKVKYSLLHREDFETYSKQPLNRA